MSQYYNPNRIRNIFDPKSKEPFKLSRSKLELFTQCPRCFYLDCRLGVGRPKGFPFNLNSAVDALLKKEFDIHRAKNTAHPLIKKYGVDAVPVAHEDLDKWRHNFTGVQYLHQPTNLLVYGAIDDLWAKASTLPNPPFRKGRENTTDALRNDGGSGNDEPEYIVVDYKATSKDEAINELASDWQDGYKRQMEIYQWLLRQNGYKVSNTGYFVYCNGRKDREAFDGKLEFDVTLIPYKGSDKWVEQTVIGAHKCLRGARIPKASADCDYCAYVAAVGGKTLVGKA